MRIFKNVEARKFRLFHDSIHLPTVFLLFLHTHIFLADFNSEEWSAAHNSKTMLSWKYEGKFVENHIKNKSQSRRESDSEGRRWSCGVDLDSPNITTHTSLSLPMTEVDGVETVEAPIQLAHNSMAVHPWCRVVDVSTCCEQYAAYFGALMQPAWWLLVLSGRRLEKFQAKIALLSHINSLFFRISLDYPLTFLRYFVLLIAAEFH